MKRIPKIPLNEFISYLTKEDIRDNARMLGEKIPMSWNKERMALALASIYERDPSVFLPMLSRSSLKIVSSVFEGKLSRGFKIDEDDLGDQYELFLDDLHELQYLGLAAYEYQVFMVADIMKKAVAGLPDNEMLDQWQQMEYCAFGILLAYGILEWNEFVRMFRRCYPELAEEEASTFLNRRVGLRLCSLRMDVDKLEEWVFLDTIDDPDGWYELIASRQDIPYRQYMKDEYLSYFSNGYLREPAYLHELIDILKRNGMDEEDAKGALLESAFDLCQQLHLSSAVPDIVDEIEWKSEKILREFINLYFQFTNDIPLWYNKGYSPNEMIAAPQGRRNPSEPSRGKVIQFPGGGPRVGRNDLCPCGSGKKYKHCCGMLN